jgi:hypothetical protein
LCRQIEGDAYVFDITTGEKLGPLQWQFRHHSYLFLSIATCQGDNMKSRLISLIAILTWTVVVLLAAAACGQTSIQPMSTVPPTSLAIPNPAKPEPNRVKLAL